MKQKFFLGDTVVITRDGPHEGRSGEVVGSYSPLVGFTRYEIAVSLGTQKFIHGPFYDRDLKILTRSEASLINEVGGDVWVEHPDHPRDDWRDEVAAGDTILGYWSWAAHREEVSGSN